MAYITTTDLKEYLGIPFSTTSDDFLIGTLIDAAQSFIDAYTGRSFEAAEDSTRTMDATDDVEGPLLWLAGDLCSITSITNGDGTTVTAGQYVTEPRRVTPFYGIKLLPSSGGRWTYSTDHEGAISIVGKWAYSETAPLDIAQACRRLAAWLYRQKDTSADTDRPLLAGDGNIIMPSALPGDIRYMLKPYRRIT